MYTLISWVDLYNIKTYLVDILNSIFRSFRCYEPIYFYSLYYAISIFFMYHSIYIPVCIALSLPQFVSQLSNFSNLFGCNFNSVCVFNPIFIFNLDKYFYILSFLIFFYPLFFISDDSEYGFLFFYRMILLNKSICIYRNLIRFRLWWCCSVNETFEYFFQHVKKQSLRPFIP